jgi:hypothetical protein
MHARRVFAVDLDPRGNPLLFDEDLPPDGEAG